MASTTLVTFDSMIYMAGNINEVKKKIPLSTLMS